MNELNSGLSLDNKTCESCKHLLPLHCHPWNTNIGKGQMSERFGFACSLFTLPEFAEDPKLIFMEDVTGVCECHTKNF